MMLLNAQETNKKKHGSGASMSSFADRFGGLPVSKVKELNEAARWYCEHEITSQTGDE